VAGFIGVIARALRTAQTCGVSDGIAAGPVSGLVGRAAELQRTSELAAELSSGQGHVLLIRGEPGIGKTALLREIAGRASVSGALLALGTAEELEQRVPFAAIAGCLAHAPADPELRRIAGVLRGASLTDADASTPADFGFIATEAILGLVDRWCSAQPVVLAIDDLHWADEASLLVLHRLGLSASQLPLLLVAACRSGAGGDDVSRLIRSWRTRGAEFMTLGPVDEPAVALLTERVTGKRPAVGLLDLLAPAGGNPLYVAEFTKALLETGRLVLTDDVADVKPAADQTAGLPESLIDAVSRRLSTLSTGARDLLRGAAIFGPRFSVADLSAASGIPAFEMLDALHELIEAGVVVTDADRLAFGHGVIQDAIYESIPRSARAALHLEAAHALARTGAPIEQVAEHLLSADLLDGEALAWMTNAADWLTMRAPELSVELFRQALEVANPVEAQVGRLQQALATALLATHRFGQAETVAREALARHSTPDQGSLRWIVVHALLNEGRAESALGETRDALASGVLSAVETARFHGIAAQLMHVLSNEGPDAAKAAARQACDVGLASGDPRAAAYGLQAIAGAERWDGRFVDALDLAGRAADHIRQAGSMFDAQLDPNLIRANCLVELGRMTEAANAYADDLRLAEAGVGTFFLAFHHLSVARMQFLSGAWDDALTEIDAARQAPDHLGYTLHLDGLATVIAAHRGDRAAVARLKTSLHRSLPTGSMRHTFDDRSWGRSMAALADGDEAGAYAVLASAWNACVQGKREFCGHYLLPSLVALGMAQGHEAEASQAVAVLNRYLNDRPGPAMHRSAAFAAALIDSDAGQLLQVADDYAAAGRPLFEAEAREQAAELLAAGGDSSAARLHLDAALRRYAAVDAHWDAARASGRLRRYGIRRGAHGQRSRPKTGWTALTPTEQKIAELVSDGMSNPDIAARTFTSRRTVQFHVSNILTKLDLTSRVELAALVARQSR